MTAVFDQLRTGLADRYELVREIGRGGMATVYLARDLRHDRDVAIKVLAPELADAVGPERFSREIRLAARLSHPHILPLLDSGEVPSEDDGPPHLWYATPYVKGESLRRRLDQEAQLPVDEATRIAAEVAEALDYAHREGCVHRDVKPGNILLQDGHAMLADFGIGRAVDPEATTELTRTGMVLGTPAYASPEQLSGEGPVDGRSDLYSLGCVLYEMLAGRAPYSGRTAAAMVAQVLAGPAVDPTELRPASAPVAPIVTRAMERLPADRFRDGREMSEALRASVAGPPSDQWAAPPPSRRRRGRLVAGAVATAVVVAAIALWSGSRGGSVAASPVSALAVLPFQTTSTGPGDADLASGLHNQVIERLQALPYTVYSRRMMMEFQGSTLDAAEIAADVGASHVVDAALSVAGGSVRIDVQLLDGTGTRVWDDDFVRPLGDVFALQSEVAEGVAAAVRGALAGTPSAGGGAVDTAALRLWTEGQRYVDRGGLLRSPDIDAAPLLDSAIASFEEAVAVDPGFARPWASLAEVFQLQASGGVPPVLADSLYRRSIEVAQRAIALDSGLAAPWQALGFAFTRTWRFDEAEAALIQADRLSPNAHHWTWAFLHRARGEAGRAADAYASAFRQDPRSFILAIQFRRALVCAGRYDEALEVSRTARDSASVFVFAGEYERAVALEEERLADNPRPFSAYIYARAGRPEEARAVWNEVAGTRRGWAAEIPGLLAVGDTAGVVRAVRRMADVRHQSLAVLPCGATPYGDLLGIEEVRSIFAEMGMPLEIR